MLTVTKALPAEIQLTLIALGRAMKLDSATIREVPLSSRATS
jgi:hypothetical protein